MIKEIRDNISFRLAAVLGPEFTKLSYATDVSLNKFGRSTKRFSVLPDSASEVDGNVGVNTLDHRFVITLTDSYNSGPVAQLNDDLKSEKPGELMSKAHLIYEDLQTNKSFLSPQVLIVNRMNIESIEYLEEEKVAVLRFEVNIKYQT